MGVAMWKQWPVARLVEALLLVVDLIAARSRC
jgi:hypothetical protein